MKFSDSRYGQWATEYMPKKTRILFVAEAPPLSLDRYFYFPCVKRGDWLWIALMKALFPSEWADGNTQTRDERKRKVYWLRKFQNNGYRLIDAVKKPMRGSNAKRVRTIRQFDYDLISEVKDINPQHVVLIKATVHEALFEKFKSAGLPVANKEPLPFPCCGHQKEFHEKFPRNLMPSKKVVEPEMKKSSQKITLAALTRRIGNSCGNNCA